MSHFSVAVLTKEEPVLDESYFIDLLEPYMENCCSTPSIDYMEFFEDDDCEIDDATGKRGYWQNPDAKWDWLAVGGRWHGLLKLRDGSSCDSARICDLAEPFATYAAVTPDLEWNEKGKMLWFGISTATELESQFWDDEFAERFLGDPELYVSIIDCHI